MCLVALAIAQSPRFPLVIASNRDEYFKRPAAPLAWWSPGLHLPDVLGGRDLASGGTWLGITAPGRLALLTNVRGGRPNDPGAPSRGGIVTDWLSGREEADAFWPRIAASGYNGCNLIAADFRHGSCFWASTADPLPRPLSTGLYGLSNASLDTPWLKVQALKAQLGDALATARGVDDLAEHLFASLADRSIAPDAALPATGIPLVWERQLSAAFIATADRSYGTRCSTVIVMERLTERSTTHLIERTFSANGELAMERRHAIDGWPLPPTQAGDPMAPASTAA